MPIIVSKRYLTLEAGEIERRYRTRSASVRECKGFAAKVAIWLSLMVAVAGCLGHDWLTVCRRAHELKVLEEGRGMAGRRLNDVQDLTDRRDIEEVGIRLVEQDEDRGAGFLPPCFFRGHAPSATLETDTFRTIQSGT